MDRVSGDGFGFRGDFKLDWRDFIVSEIGLDGVPVHWPQHARFPGARMWDDFELMRKSSQHASESQGLDELEKYPFIECTLNKKNVSHEHAIKLISSKLDLLPSDISFREAKDKVGDTYQKVRINTHGRADAVLREARSFFPSVGIILENFQGAHQALKKGKDISGNMYSIILRNVTVSGAQRLRQDSEIIADRVAQWQSDGFLNFYGPEAFGWFRGKNDCTHYLMQGNALWASYQLLNYTRETHSWLELLERHRLYPLESQEFVRREILLNLAKAGIGPHSIAMLDSTDFADKKMESPDEMCTSVDFADSYPSHARTAMNAACEKAIAKALEHGCLDGTTFQRYLWNQAVSRIAKIHGVPLYDPCCPCALCIASQNVYNTPLYCERLSAQDGSTQKNNTSLFLPALPLAHEASYGPGCFSRTGQYSCAFSQKIDEIYQSVCTDFMLQWPSACPFHAKGGLVLPRRRMLAHPMHVHHQYDAGSQKLLLRFSLPYGSYVTAALYQLFGMQSVPLAHSIIRTPLDNHFWKVGSLDTEFVPTKRDMYIASEEGEGPQTSSAKHHAPITSSNFGAEGEAVSSMPVAEIARWTDEFVISNRTLRSRKLEENVANRLELRPDLILEASANANYANGHSVPLRGEQSLATVRTKLSKRAKLYASLRRADSSAYSHRTRRRNISESQIEQADFAPTQHTPRYHHIDGSWWNRAYCHKYHPMKSKS